MCKSIQMQPSIQNNFANQIDQFTLAFFSSSATTYQRARIPKREAGHSLAHPRIERAPGSLEPA